MDYFPELNTVCMSGWEAVKCVTKDFRLDDPFAFVDDLNGLGVAQPPSTDVEPLSEQVEKSIVVRTVGDLWKVLAEGGRPCFECSGIVLGPGTNTPSITCPNPVDELRRITLDWALAIVTVEGGDKAAAMEKLVARLQLQKGMDKASVINFSLAEFVEACTGIRPAEHTTPQPKTAEELDAERLAAATDGLTPQATLMLRALWSQRDEIHWSKLPGEAFREGPARTPEAEFEALKRLRTLLTANYSRLALSLSVSEKKQTAKLTKNPLPKGGK